MNTDEPISVTVAEYWGVIVRRKWLIASTIVVSVLVAGVLCLVLPKSYRSSTLIIIENAKIPEDYVKGIGGGNIEERLTMIQQQVMSRTLLSQIIEEFKLYESAIKREGLESIIEQMRKTIKVETFGASKSSGKSIEAFTISFNHENPMTAMKVTAKLASQFIEENLKVREQLVTGVSVFLEQELQTAKTVLEAQEQAISQFKAKHIGLLPEQMESNLRALDRMQTDLHAADEMLRTLTDRLSLVENSIKEYEASGTTSSTPGQTASHAGLDPLVGRLRELEKTETSLLAEYKETYPDIVQVKQEIESVKRQLATKYGKSAAGKDGDAAKMVDPYLRELLKQRNELRAEALSVKDRRERLARHIKEFEIRVEQTPSREQELMVLLRDYENGQKNYQSLLEKRLNAHVAENLEKRQKGEQFRIIDPANLPEHPEKPSQFYIMLIGVAAGCGLGVAGAIFLEQMSPPFRRPEEVESVLGLPVLGVIPHFNFAYGKAVGSTGARQERKKATRDVDSIAWSKKLNWVAKICPHSLVAEQFRVIASRVVLLSAQRRSTVVVVTSAVMGEGKSSTALNLSYVLAQNLGKRTLLMDVDFKAPAIHSYAGITNECGLLDLLAAGTGRTDLIDRYTQRSTEAPLWILPAGEAQTGPSELSTLHQLDGLCLELQSRFEFIVVDAPPILPLADMQVLAQMADVLLLVVRADKTPQEAVQKSLHMLSPKSPAGIVLTGVAQADIPYYLHHYSTQSDVKRIETSL